MTMMINHDKPGLEPNAERDRARGRRNVVIALALAAFALLFFVITLLKFGGGHGAP